MTVRNPTPLTQEAKAAWLASDEDESGPIVYHTVPNLDNTVPSLKDVLPEQKVNPAFSDHIFKSGNLSLDVIAPGTSLLVRIGDTQVELPLSEVQRLYKQLGESLGD